MMDKFCELRSLIARHTVPGAAPVVHGHVRLAASATPTRPMGSIIGPIFVIVAQGAKRTVLGNRRFEYADGQYFIVSVELPMTGSVTRANRTRPFLTFGLILQPVVIASLLLQAPAIRFASGDVSSAAVSDMQDDLLDASVRLLRLLDTPEDAPILRDMIECEIHWRLLNSPQGAMVRQIEVPVGSVGVSDTLLLRLKYWTDFCLKFVQYLSAALVALKFWKTI